MFADRIIKKVFISRNFYSSFALVADPVDGPIFSSLLVGPCALEYTKLKTCDHLWSDPNADELIQRHRMQNSNCSFGNSFCGNTSINSNNNSSFNTSNGNVFHYPLQSPKPKLSLNASIILKRNASTNNNSTISIDDSTNGSPILFTSNNNNILKTPLTPSSFNSNVSNQSSPSISINYNAKEYVESLHQNSKSQLIYGKNYVIVYPV